MAEHRLAVLSVAVPLATIYVSATPGAPPATALCAALGIAAAAAFRFLGVSLSRKNADSASVDVAAVLMAFIPGRWRSL